MAEEFIEDIIGVDVAPKTEAEMAADIQGLSEEEVTEQPDKTEADESRMGGEADPDESQQAESDSADDAAIKELAAQIGWREDHKGEDAIDAKTYILRSKDIQKTMGQHNKDLKDQLKALGGSVDALKQHNESVYKVEVKKLTDEIAGLKQERRDAIELADVEKVEALDKQIDEKQKDIDAPKAADKQASDQVENPVFDTWIKDNEWYLKDDDMAKFADTVAQQYVGAPLDRVYKIVRTKVQEVFPEKFDAVPAAAPVKDAAKNPVGPASPVERSSAKVEGGSFTKADLSQDQLQIMRQFVQGGIMTEEQYVNDIAKMQ